MAKIPIARKHFLVDGAVAGVQCSGQGERMKDADMTTLYKLTNRDGCTYGPTLWEPGTSHTAKKRQPRGASRRLCTGELIHAYRTPLQAAFMHPVHVQFTGPRLWEASGRVLVDDGTKVGCRTLTTIREIPLPKPTTDQRVRFAILCAQEVMGDDAPEWSRWAARWLSGEDRTVTASAWAAEAARAARINIPALAEKAMEDGA